MKSKLANARSTSIDTNIIVDFLNTTLQTATIRDYSSNGLQVQGIDIINKIGLAVDACIQSYELAAAQKCQLLIVHHGIIWNGLHSITGRYYRHIKYLIANEINLYASHLPLDLHPQVGNNMQLAKMLSLQKIKSFGLYNGVQIGFEGILPSKSERNKLVNILCKELDTECTIFPFGKEMIQRVAIVSGGAGKELTEAIQKGIDCFITGESVHENYHAALEAGINVIYAGHYHTEKVGVQALGKLIEKQFGIETVFLDTPPIIERQVSI